MSASRQQDMINQQSLFLPLFNVRQYLFCVNSIICYRFKIHPSGGKNNTKKSK